ncbi:MAG: carboxypeptidase-like regulatory domain-containing protein [Planctomycetaceae bacterium]|jgi:hypothetical protein|nr:carboxypeptidase-like regulatory domain-containing protein [Planctomycetaceae bacterium]
MVRFFTFLGCFLILTGISGCGTEGKGLRVEYVEGVISLEGKPLPGASVTFIPLAEDGAMEAAGGYSNENGVYRLTSGNGNSEKGAVLGEYRVLVSKIEAKDLTEGKEYGTSTGYAKTFTQKQLLPSVYQDRTKSPLRATVKKGKNKGLDFDLKSNPSP